MGKWRPYVSATDLAAVLREQLEEIIPPDRREPEWAAKWEEVEQFASDLDGN